MCICQMIIADEMFWSPRQFLAVGAFCSSEESSGSPATVLVAGAFVSRMQKTRFIVARREKAPAGKERRRGYQSVAGKNVLVAPPRF